MDIGTLLMKPNDFSQKTHTIGAKDLGLSYKLITLINMESNTDVKL